MSLYYAILGLLSHKPMTGYDLKKLFDESINNFWAASVSQIYRELGSMEKNGHVGSVVEEQRDRPDKRIYSVTEAGRSAFRGWMENPPEKLSKQTREEFALRVFFGAEMGRAECLSMLKRFLQQKERVRDTAIPEIGRNIDRYSSDFASKGDVFYWRMIENRARILNEASIRWARECIEELEKTEKGEDKP